MRREDAEADMLQGYLDGLKGDPEPGANRSHSYRHGWLNGRDDRNKSPRDAACFIRVQAIAAIAADMNT